MTSETEETVLDLRSVIELVIADLRSEKNAWAGSGAYAPMNSAANRLAAALSRAPEAEREGAAERLAIVAEKPARLIRWGEGDRLDIQSVLAALSPPSTGGALTGGGFVYHNPDVGTEYAPSHPVESGEVPDATDIRASTQFEDWLVREAAVNRPTSPEMGEWRPEVRAFADLMEAQLRANDHKPGWKDDTDLDLFERLGQESAELLAALRRNAKRLMWGDSWVMEDTVPRVGAEAADVANFAMMIADVCGALKLKENGLSREGLA